MIAFYDFYAELLHKIPVSDHELLDYYVSDNETPVVRLLHKL